MTTQALERWYDNKTLGFFQKTYSHELPVEENPKNPESDIFDVQAICSETSENINNNTLGKELPNKVKQALTEIKTKETSKIPKVAAQRELPYYLSPESDIFKTQAAISKQTSKNTHDLLGKALQGNDETMTFKFDTNQVTNKSTILPLKVKETLEEIKTHESFKKETQKLPKSTDANGYLEIFEISEQKIIDLKENPDLWKEAVYNLFQSVRLTPEQTGKASHDGFIIHTPEDFDVAKKLINDSLLFKGMFGSVLNKQTNIKEERLMGVLHYISLDHGWSKEQYQAFVNNTQFLQDKPGSTTIQDIQKIIINDPHKVAIVDAAVTHKDFRRKRIGNNLKRDSLKDLEKLGTEVVIGSISFYPEENIASFGAHVVAQHIPIIGLTDDNSDGIPRKWTVDGFKLAKYEMPILPA